MAAMLSLFLLVLLPGSRLSCLARQVESVNSPELDEEASKLSRKYEAADPLYGRSLSILEKKWGPESKYEPL